MFGACFQVAFITRQTQSKRDRDWLKMTKRMMAAALSLCLLAPAYAKDAERLDQLTFARQARMAAQYLGDQASSLVVDHVLAMTPEHQREFDRLLADKQQAARWESEIRGRVMRQFVGYIVQCYAGNQADLCAYRDIAGRTLMRQTLEQSNDKQPIMPLHEQTQSWITGHPRQAAEAEQIAEWMARLALHPGSKDR